MAAITTDQLRRVLGTTVAVNNVSLRIESGELFLLLGPSGCGKSTLLGLIAGLDSPDSGRIFFAERDVTLLPTEQRNAVMCFQSYALFPHMTVEQNVRFGLKVRRLDEGAQQRRVQAVLELVQLKELSQRKPAQLSGGQQQRVALARALAVEPACLLLDEPLSNLDAKLRQEMRGELQRLCKASGHTTIYVTHDQKEALSIADRIAVMNQGRVIQVGTPAQLYSEPNCSFVAEFISHANVIPGQIIAREHDCCLVKTALGVLRAKSRPNLSAEAVLLSVRPDQVRWVHQPAAGCNRFEGTLLSSGFLGESSEHWVRSGEQSLRLIHSPPLFSPPEHAQIEIRPDDLIIHEQ